MDINLDADAGLDTNVRNKGISYLHIHTHARNTQVRVNADARCADLAATLPILTYSSFSRLRSLCM